MFSTIPTKIFLCFQAKAENVEFVYPQAAANNPAPEFPPAFELLLPQDPIVRERLFEQQRLIEQVT